MAPCTVLLTRLEGSVVVSHLTAILTLAFHMHHHLNLPIVSPWSCGLKMLVVPTSGILGNRNDPGACNYGINIVNTGGDKGIGITYYDPTNPGYPGNNSDDPNYLDCSRYQVLPTVNVLHHLAASLQQIASDSIQIKTYYDGQLVYTKVMPGNFAHTLNTLPLTIGATDPTGEFLTGTLDEVSLYNRCLSLAEANAILSKWLQWQI